MIPDFAERYVTADNRGFLEDTLPVLPYLTFDEAWQFYVALMDSNISGKVEKETIAAIGLCDRYYLLTHLCGAAHMTIHGRKGNAWLYDRCREVEREPCGYLDLWAREHYKSTIITFGGSIQHIARDPEITIGIFANTNKVAKPFLQQIKREVESNDTLKSVFDDVFWQNPQKEAPLWSVQEGIIVQRQGNPKEATVEAHGLIEGMPTGRHFKLRIYDDVVTRESVGTEDQIRKTTEARELSDNLGAGNNDEWNAGTRYHFADTYGVMLERQQLKPRLHPATDNGRLEGEPVFFSEAKWEEKKRNQPSQIAAQMLQNPAAGQETVFDPAWLKATSIRPGTLNIYILVDPSKGPSTARRSDNTAMAVIGIDASNNKYLLDGFRHRMNLEERWKRLRMLWKKWTDTRGVMIVNVGYERYGMQSDIEHFEFMMREKGPSFGIQEVAWPREGGGSKQDRVERLVPDFSSGKFFLPSVVWHETYGTATWAFDEDLNKMVYSQIKGPTKQQRRMTTEGQDYRIIKPIKRVNENGETYDLTRSFIEEYLFFPFGSRDDLIDAVDRIHDMDPTAPMIVNDADLNPTVYQDGV